ncbi:MAG: thioredoxin domain-containing protein [Candidatus Saccharibacteria bacterium]|nr:thioredoxin domain-containing protein [Candidatus Saccharibacteria bacterium]
MQKAFRIIGITGIIILILAAIITSTTAKTPTSEKVWDEAMTIGDIEAKNHFVIYSDIACPYCIAFENAIIENQEAFEKYIAENDILLEIRVSDYLYEYGQYTPKSSRLSALGTYCAKNEGKFWNYYDLAVSRVWNDYYKNMGKAGATSLSELTEDYWIDLGKEIGLGETFASCVKNQDPLEEIKENALKSVKSTEGGLPYFKFNNYVSSGFDLSWGWEYVLMYFDAGLKS